jgi:hypothetical protein
MEDFFAEILAIIAEAFLEIAGELLISLLARGTGKLLKAILDFGPVASAAGVVLLGTISGACSYVIFPHPLFHPSKVHGLSLIVSPVIAGLFMSQLGRYFRRRGAETIPIESFALGSTFAFAMAVVRFALVR